LAGSTTKKAIVRRFDKEPLPGWVNPASYLQPSGIELLATDGRSSSIIPYEDIKTVSFVREFGPLEIERQVFQTRPKMDGLWVRLRFRDSDIMEGVMTNNLLQVELPGFTIIPPDSYSNQQRVFVPRVALASIEVLGVVGSSLGKRKAKPAAKEQIGLFEE
jgi:hypothetical protein